jgi:hypothetical protein
MEDVMSRFLRGLNSEIRTMLIPETCDHVSYLFCLARKAENQMLSSISTCKNDVTHDDSHLSTLHANPEQQIVEPAIDLPLSHCDLLAKPCYKDEFCDTSMASPQLEIEHYIVPLLLPNIFQEDDNNSIECIEEIKLVHPLLQLEKNDRAAPIALEESKEGNAGGARIPQSK